MRVMLTVLCIIIIIPTAFSQQKETIQKIETKKILNIEVIRNVEIQYYLHLPEGYESGNRKYPLMMYLHGSGERGDDLEVLNANGLPSLINEKKIQFPFITVSPQCPREDYWGSGIQTENLNALLDHLIENYSIDENRIYLTGLSMGGYGTWGLATRYPNRFAALAPICGGWNPAEAAKVKHLPVWVFHGAKDKIVPIQQSEEMVAALKKEGGNVKYTVYPEATHDSWTETYFNPELFEWFLSHRKQKDGTISSQKPGLLTPKTREALLFNYMKYRLAFTDTQGSIDKEVEFSFEINNPLSVPISIEKEWSYAKGSTWKVEELNDITTSIQPSETKTIKFIAKTKDKNNPFPLPLFKVLLATEANKGQSEIILPLDVDQYLTENPTYHKAINTDSPPAIDGKLDDTIWKKSDAIGTFFCNTLKEAPVVNTEAWIAYDNSYCYVAIKCVEPNINQLVAKVKENDGPVWTDDSIEFFLDPENNRQGYFQFVVNSQGNIYDVFNGNNLFTSEAKIATQAGSDYWSVEMAIPWEKLNVNPPEKGQHMGFLIGRNRIEKAATDKRGIAQFLQYPPTNGSNHRKEFFGNLEF